MNPIARLRQAPSVEGTEDGHALVSRIAAADADALAELYDRRAPGIYSFAFRIVGNAKDAEEITESTFWCAWRTVGEYDLSRGAVEDWLRSIARSRATECLRSRRGTGGAAWSYTRSLDGGSPSAAAPAGDGEAPQRRAAVLRALDTLPPEQRQALEPACFGGMSPTEIAERMEQPSGTVLTWIRVAMERLRAALS